MTGDKFNPQEMLKFKAHCDCTGATASKVKYSWLMNQQKAIGPERMDMSKVSKTIKNEPGWKQFLFVYFLLI